MISLVKLTVLFENPFWIGVFEIEEDKCYKVCKVTFGAEPKEAEVLEFVVRNYYKLRFTTANVEDNIGATKSINPKRVQRQIRKQLDKKEIGTKAQNALKEQYEKNKIQRKKLSKERRETEEERKFQLKAEKRKEKHRGH